MSDHHESKEQPAKDAARSAEDIPLDHFYQLVLMHERTTKAWLEEYMPQRDAGTTQQEKLANERKKLLQQKTVKKKSKK